MAHEALSDQTMRVFSFPATLVSGEGERTSDAALLEIAKTQHAYDTSVFEERVAVFLGGEISSNRIDAYFTQMDTSALKNYATEAAAGVSVLVGHNRTGMPFGRSLTGVFHDGRGTGVKRTTSEFFTLRDLTLNGQPTNDLIDAARAGIVTDMSIGFYGGKMLCNICKRDMLRDWDCWHIPGFTYDKSKPDSHEVVEGGTLCVGQVNESHLAEYSLVYDGATPGAGLGKAQREAAAGRMNERLVRAVEAKYRAKMPDAEHVYPGAETRDRPVEGARGVDEKEQERLVAAERDLAAVRAVLAQAKALIPSPDASLSDWMRSALESRDSQIAEMTPWAEEGRTARTELVEAALAAGERAFGTTFNKEIYAEQFKTASRAFILQIAADWVSRGDTIFQGGRSTTEGETPAPPAEALPTKLTDLSKLVDAQRSRAYAR